MDNMNPVCPTSTCSAGCGPPWPPLTAHASGAADKWHQLNEAMLIKHCGLERQGAALACRMPIPPAVPGVAVVCKLAEQARAATSLAWDMHFLPLHVPVVDGVLVLRGTLRLDGFVVEILSADRPYLVRALAARCARAVCQRCTQERTRTVPVYAHRTGHSAGTRHTALERPALLKGAARAGDTAADARARRRRRRHAAEHRRLGPAWRARRTQRGRRRRRARRAGDVRRGVRVRLPRLERVQAACRPAGHNPADGGFVAAAGDARWPADCRGGGRRL